MGVSHKRKRERGCEWRGYYLKGRGRLVLAGTINEGLQGWGAVCLHL